MDSEESSLFAFPREVPAAGLTQTEHTEWFDHEIRGMLPAAGMSLRRKQFRSILRSLVGGGLHDISGGARDATMAGRYEVDDLIYFNVFAQNRGPRAFADTYNDGALPQAVITDPIGISLPNRDGQTAARVLPPLASLVLLVGLFTRDSRLVAIAGIGVLGATVTGVGWIMADNFRFLPPSYGFALAAATQVAWAWGHERLGAAASETVHGASRLNS